MLTEKTTKTTAKSAPITLLSSNEFIICLTLPCLTAAFGPRGYEPIIPRAVDAGEIARKLGLLLVPCNTYKSHSDASGDG